LVVMIISLFIMWPALSYADWHNHDGDRHGHHDGDHHDRDRHDRDGHHGYSHVDFDFSVWPNSYYYSTPYYPPADAILVSPPIYQPVVQQPVTVVQPPVVVDNQLLPADSFTINIPNDNGGYTAVTLRKSGNGFIGPQGEFYPGDTDSLGVVTL